MWALRCQEPLKEQLSVDSPLYVCCPACCTEFRALNTLALLLKQPPLLQGDGTLESLLSSTGWLSTLLDVLCGTGSSKREPDDGVREALAETVLMLVSLCGLLAVPVRACSLVCEENS